MKFNKAKCQFLHLHQCNPKHRYRLGRELIESSSEEKDLGVLVNRRHNTTQQCAFAVQNANHILGCIKRGVGSRSKEVILPPYSILQAQQKNIMITSFCFAKPQEGPSLKNASGYESATEAAAEGEASFLFKDWAPGHPAQSWSAMSWSAPSVDANILLLPGEASLQASIMLLALTVISRVICRRGPVDVDDEIKCNLRNFADDTKLSGEVEILEETATLQVDLDSL
ncbi:hypothetical protein BTVI_67612 [Pitangus sulphuratus]|nr:hypothetical protein BTVI_67612 [Pitangus sulphuratus]